MTDWTHIIEVDGVLIDGMTPKELRKNLAKSQAEIERLKAEQDKAWTRHLIEREELKAEKAALQTEIERLRELNDSIPVHEIHLAKEADYLAVIEKLHDEIARLKAERHTTKQMLEDILYKHGQHYGLGRGGLRTPEDK